MSNSCVVDDQCSVLEWCDASNALDAQCRYRGWVRALLVGGCFVAFVLFTLGCSLVCCPFC